MPMSDEEREERAEQRAIRKRAERINTVWGALSRTKRKTSAELAAETGYTKETILSTINLIRRNIPSEWAGEPVAYDPSTHQFWIPATFAQERKLIEWLRKHLATRVRSLDEFLDVAAAKWPGDVPISLIVGAKQLELAMEQLEKAIYIEEQAALKAQKPPKLIG